MSARTLALPAVVVRRISRRHFRGDGVFRGTQRAAGVLLIVLVLAMVVTMAVTAWPAVAHFGLRFLFTTSWDPVQDEYGALPFIYGTLVTSFVALLLHAQFISYVLLLIWSIVLQVMGFSEIQGLATRKAFGVWFVGQIIGFLLSLFLALIIETLFPGLLVHVIPQNSR